MICFSYPCCSPFSKTGSLGCNICSIAAADGCSLSGTVSALQGGGTSGSEVAERAKDEAMEMEVTFGGGLDGLSQRLKARLADRVNKKDDTVWQAYLRRRE